MAEKKFKIVVHVDLDCCRCKKKIRGVVSKLQDREKIGTVEYDEKDSKVTITGPFNAERLSRKLRCKASKCIKGIEIIEVTPPPTQKRPPPPPPKQEVVCVVCCAQPCPCHRGRTAQCCYCRCKNATDKEEKRAPCCCYMCKKDKKSPYCWQPCPCHHGVPNHGYNCCSCSQDDGCSLPPQCEKPPPPPMPAMPASPMPALPMPVRMRGGSA